MTQQVWSITSHTASDVTHCKWHAPHGALLFTFLWVAAEYVIFPYATIIYWAFLDVDFWSIGGVRSAMGRRGFPSWGEYLDSRIIVPQLLSNGKRSIRRVDCGRGPQDKFIHNQSQRDTPSIPFSARKRDRSNCGTFCELVYVAVDSPKVLLRTN